MSKQSSFRMPTILCAFHTNQIIQQFCYSKQCMLPLCRVCMPIHQKQHTTMPCKPSLVSINQLTSKINYEINNQKQNILKKHSVIKRFYRISADVHQETLKKLQNSRILAIEEINRKYNVLVSDICNLYEQKITQIKTIHLKLETLEETLEKLKETFSESKPMRTVIMWESKSLGQVGSNVLAQIEQKIKNDQNQQQENNQYLLNNINTETKVKRNQSQNESKQMDKYLKLLGSIIEKNLYFKNSNEVKKSIMKLRTSGISLTDVSLIKSDTKRSKEENAFSTPGRQGKQFIKQRQINSGKGSEKITTKR